MSPHPKKIVFSLCFIVIFFSCISSTYNLESHIGLYKVIESNCKLTEGLFNPCDDIKFIEIVKGQFYGINPDQLALVHWHSETGSSEIEYTANLISNHKQKLREGNKIWLTNQSIDNESEKEFFILKAGKITEYFFQFQRKNKAGKVIWRDFHYKLAPSDRREIKKFKLNYPPK